MLYSDIDRRCRRQLGAQAGGELGSAGARQRPGVGPGTAAEEDVDAEGLPDGATRSPTRSAPAKDRRNYYDPGEQEQEEGGNVPDGGQDHHAEQDCRQRSPAWDTSGSAVKRLDSFTAFEVLHIY
jgi:hypothetical protein